RRSASSIRSCCGRLPTPPSAGGRRVIEMRRAQLSFGDGLIAEEVSDLRDHWIAAADQVLADEDIVVAVYEALAQRHPKSGEAEVGLRQTAAWHQPGGGAGAALPPRDRLRRQAIQDHLEADGPGGSAPGAR